MKTYVCNICNKSDFTNPHQVGAHKRNVHPEHCKPKKKPANRKPSVAMTVLNADVQTPPLEGVKYCPECGHFLLPYTAALSAMKGRRT